MGILIVRKDEIIQAQFNLRNTENYFKVFKQAQGLPYVNNPENLAQCCINMVRNFLKMHIPEFSSSIIGVFNGLVTDLVGKNIELPIISEILDDIKKLKISYNALINPVKQLLKQIIKRVKKMNDFEDKEGKLKELRSLKKQLTPI